MSSVVKVGKTVRRSCTPASETIQKYLAHLRSQGVDWVPEPLGFEDDGREILSFIEGQTVDGIPAPWFWKEKLLADVAQRARQLHDASVSFDLREANWSFYHKKPAEVIVHNDFAPYNCVFQDEEFVGLIDFDLCEPGYRLWDIAYMAYRFIPLMPRRLPGQAESWSLSPFGPQETTDRLKIFLDAYAAGDDTFAYSIRDAILTTIERLDTMVDWIEKWEQTHPNSDLAQNKITYTEHRGWLNGYFGYTP